MPESGKHVALFLFKDKHWFFELLGVPAAPRIFDLQGPEAFAFQPSSHKFVCSFGEVWWGLCLGRLLISEGRQFDAIVFSDWWNKVWNFVGPVTVVVPVVFGHPLDCPAYVPLVIFIAECAKCLSQFPGCNGNFEVQEPDHGHSAWSVLQG